MNIVGVSGSLRIESTNTRLLTAASSLATDGMTINVTDLVAKLPLFSPDLDPELISDVRLWVTQMRESDGIIVSTPEYARGYPGSLKNAFDWLVQGDGFVEKPFMFLTASERAKVSQATLAVVLETMSGLHITEADATVPLLGTKLTAAQIVAHAAHAAVIRTSLATFARKLRELNAGG